VAGENQVASTKNVLVVYIFRRVQKIAKSDITYITSVCPSVRMEQLGSHWTDFHEI
jgi:hypothetical protein